MSTPIDELVTRVDAGLAWLAIRRGMPDDPAWVRCADVLADPAGLPRWLTVVTDGVTRRSGGTAPPLVTPASYLMAWYLDVPAYVGGLSFGLARRVPSLAPEDLAVHLDPGGWPDGVALLGHRFSCLPDDPDAGHADADVVDDETELAAVLRHRLTAHANAFHETYTPGVKMSSKQRWGTLTDVLEVALWSSGAPRGDEALGVADAALVLDDVHPPLTSASRMYSLVDDRGRRRWTRRRESCCFYFRLPGSEVCFTCPRVSDAERVARASLDA